jgi:uncharacterized protein (TIGR02217 family)
MAFFEELFPPKISANMTGGPKFITSKAYMIGGQRITNREAQLPLHEYRLSHPVRAGRDFDELRSFFYVVGGDADGFRFKDWSDYQCSAAQSSMSLVVAGQYQMNKRYVYGSRTFTRKIQKPVTGAQIFRTRTGTTTNITSTDASVNTATGIVTIANHASGDVYTWSGEFHIPAALKDPAAVFRIIGGSNILTEWPDLEVEEIRV